MCRKSPQDLAEFSKRLHGQGVSEAGEGAGTWAAGRLAWHRGNNSWKIGNSSPKVPTTSLLLMTKPPIPTRHVPGWSQCLLSPCQGPWGGRRRAGRGRACPSRWGAGGPGGWSPGTGGPPCCTAPAGRSLLLTMATATYLRRRFLLPGEELLQHLPGLPDSPGLLGLEEEPRPAFWHWGYKWLIIIGLDSVIRGW